MKEIRETGFRVGKLLARKVPLVVGAALLAMETAWVLVPAIPLWLVARHGLRASGRAVLAFGATVLVVAGWWFGWAQAVYGGFLGFGARVGSLHFAPYQFHGLHGVAHVVENVVTYLWVPTEYYRNLIGAPLIVKGAVAVVTVGLLTTGLAAFWRGWGHLGWK